MFDWNSEEALQRQTGLSPSHFARLYQLSDNTIPIAALILLTQFCAGVYLYVVLRLRYREL